MDVNRVDIKALLQAWEQSMRDQGADFDTVYCAAAILLVGYAKTDKDLEKLCQNLWLIWETHKDAMQGM